MRGYVEQCSILHAVFGLRTQMLEVGASYTLLQITLCGAAVIHNGLGQATYTCVPLSPSSII